MHTAVTVSFIEYPGTRITTSEARRIEKAEAARAKARVQEKLAEDKIARRLKLGLPAELTEVWGVVVRVDSSVDPRA